MSFLLCKIKSCSDLKWRFLKVYRKIEMGDKILKDMVFMCFDTNT